MADSKTLATNDVTNTQISDNANLSFYSSMCHEMKTPLCVILGAVKLIEMQINDYDEKMKCKINTIKRNCYRLLRTIGNVVEYSKIESNEFCLNLTHCNICSLTEEIASSVIPYAQESGCNIVIKIKNKCICTSIDIDKYEKILLNLLSNAIKHSKSSDITVSLSQSENNIILTVDDNGIGIPQDILDTVFNKYTRGIDSKSGSGIGLWLVKTLAQMHGGTIDLKSNKSIGTSISINIPITNKETHIKEHSSNYIKERIDDSIKIELSDIYKLL